MFQSRPDMVDFRLKIESDFCGVDEQDIHGGYIVPKSLEGSGRRYSGCDPYNPELGIWN